MIKTEKFSEIFVLFYFSCAVSLSLLPSQYPAQMEQKKHRTFHLNVKMQSALAELVGMLTRV